MILWSLFLLACNPSANDSRLKADKLNRMAYAERYKHLGKVMSFADEAYVVAEEANYKSGMCEALCNKTFFALARMNYHGADSLLNLASTLAPDNPSRLAIEVLYMRLCQRRSQNKDFYVHEFQAERLITRIHNSIRSLDERQRRIYTSSRIDYGIVLSAYLYYVDRKEESSSSLLAINEDKDITLQSDTALWLAYLYNVGSGGILKDKDKRILHLSEFKYLMQCYMLASHYGYEYWEANALQALSEYVMDNERFDELKDADPASLNYLNSPASPDSLIANQLAERALNIFVRYGDVYQSAGAWRTLANSYFHIQDSTAMLNCLLAAVSDSAAYQAPNLIESINERLCIAYSAMDDNVMSNISRNQYLDVQDSTRQDRQLEARADAMSRQLRFLQGLVVAILTLLILMGVTVSFLIYHRRKHGLESRFGKLTDRIEELEENISMLTLQISDGRRLSVEQHSKISLVQSLQPLIDRMQLAARHCETDLQSREYLADLCASVSQGNEALTRWIQLRKGSVKLKIETFAVQEILDVIQLNTVPFTSKGVALVVEPSDIYLKADRSLTLFLLNTIVDNARKFTPSGGSVTVTCQLSSEEGYADISVADTGEGLTQDAANRLFEYRVIEDGEENLAEQKSHGFGLMNCRGIIDRYRKSSTLFARADIKAESRVGQGTKITFRLPYVAKMLAVVLLTFISVGVQAVTTSDVGYAMRKANAYGDSLYNSNVEGLYEASLIYADSCRHYLNEYYLSKCPDGKDTLASSGESGELKWWNAGFDVDYGLVLSLRNETAIAALGVHRWDVYEYNNDIYTSLYRKCSADTTLNDYFRRMETYESAAHFAVLVLLLLVAGLLVIFYLYFVKDYLLAKNDLNVRIAQLEEQETALRAEQSRLYVSNSIAENCLSTIKHETMYYPARISQLIASGDYGKNLTDTISFYRTLYVVLSSHCQRLVSDVPVQIQSMRWSDLKASCASYIEADCDEGIMAGATILANTELMRYLFLILKKKNGGKVAVVGFDAECADGNVRAIVRCEGVDMPEDELKTLFHAHTSDVDYLILKQIMREIGDRTLHYGAGISATKVDGVTHFYITIPIKR